MLMTCDTVLVICSQSHALQFQSFFFAKYVALSRQAFNSGLYHRFVVCLFCIMIVQTPYCVDCLYKTSETIHLDLLFQECFRMYGKTGQENSTLAYCPS